MSLTKCSKKNVLSLCKFLDKYLYTKNGKKRS